MIDVLLATYKPRADWLKAQIDSITCSLDKVNIVRREDAEGLGACHNFSMLLQDAAQRSTADYFAFCDQDDVWFPGKLDKSLLRMRQLEDECGCSTPLLVFSDAAVVNENLSPIAESLLKNIHVNPKRILPRQLVFQNVANGNTMLFNRALLQRAVPVPRDATMHDCWIALVASVYGRMSYISEPTVLYRQHVANVIGGGKVGYAYYWQRMKMGLRAVRESNYRSVRQASALPAFSYLIDFENKSWLARRLILIRHGLWKNGLFRNLITMMDV